MASTKRSFIVTPLSDPQSEESPLQTLPPISNGNDNMAVEFPITPIQLPPTVPVVQPTNNNSNVNLSVLSTGDLSTSGLGINLPSVNVTPILEATHLNGDEYTSFEDTQYKASINSVRVSPIDTQVLPVQGEDLVTINKIYDVSTPYDDGPGCSHPGDLSPVNIVRTGKIRIPHGGGDGPFTEGAGDLSPVNIMRTGKIRIPHGGGDDVNIMRTGKIKVDCDGRDDVNIMRTGKIKVDCDGRDDVNIMRTGKIKVEHGAKDDVNIMRTGKIKVECAGNDDINIMRTGKVRRGGGRKDDLNIMGTGKVKVERAGNDDVNIMRTGKIRTSCGGQDDVSILPVDKVRTGCGGRDDVSILPVGKVRTGCGGRDDVSILPVGRVRLARGGQDDVSILHVGRVRTERGGKDDVSILPIDESKECSGIYSLLPKIKGEVIDAVAVGSRRFYLLRWGDIISVRDTDVNSDLLVEKIKNSISSMVAGIKSIADLLKLRRIVVFYGHIYGISEGDIFILNTDSFDTCEWQWIRMINWPSKVIDISCSVDGLLMWIATAKGGYKVSVKGKPEKVYKKPYTRRYARDQHTYAELRPVNTLRVYENDSIKAEYSNIRDACYDHNQILHVLSCKESGYYAIRLVRNKIEKL